MQDTLRILVLCYEYPPIGGGGGRVAKSIAEQMAVRGHEVRVQTAALRFRSVHEQFGGVSVHRTASGRRLADTCRVPEMGAYCLTSFLPSLRHICDWQPDVIHAHFAMPTGLLAWAVHRLTKVPYVLTAHLGDVPGGVPEQTANLFRLLGPFARNIWAEAARCTAVSSFVQELAEMEYRRPVERILNGIDLTDAPLTPPPINPVRRLVYVGRFSVQKNPLLLIEALAQIPVAPWQLTMIGDGPLMPEVRDRIQRRGLINRVSLPGWCEAAKVHRILAESDILCMPSLSEGLPVAAIEALKHGLAIISTDIPGVRDVLEPGLNGLSAPLRDPAAFAARLGEMLADDTRLTAMKLASRQKATAFDLRAIADQYELVLREAAVTRRKVRRA